MAIGLIALFHTWLLSAASLLFPPACLVQRHSIWLPRTLMLIRGTTAVPLQLAVYEGEQRCTNVAQKKNGQLCGLICEALPV